MLWAYDPAKGPRRSAFVYALAEGLLIGDLTADTILAAERSDAVPSDPNTVLYDISKSRGNIEDHLQVPNGWVEEVLLPIIQQGNLGKTSPDKRIYGHVSKPKPVNLGGEADLALRTAMVVSTPDDDEPGLSDENRLLLGQLFEGDGSGNGWSSLEILEDLVRFLITIENARAQLPPSTREVDFNLDPARIEARERQNWRIMEIIRLAEGSNGVARRLESRDTGFDLSEVIADYCESMASGFQAVGPVAAAPKPVEEAT